MLKADRPSDLLAAFADQYGKRYDPCYLYGDGTAPDKIAEFLKEKCKPGVAANRKTFMFPTLSIPG